MTERATLVEPIGPFKTLAHRFRLAIDDPDLAIWARAAFDSMRCDQADVVDDVDDVTIQRQSADAYLVRSAGLPAARVSAPRVLPTLMAHLNRRAVESVPDHLVIHAAVVGLGDSAVVLPGGSGSGKSTLSALVAMAGHPYGGDELAAISFDDLCVMPNPKPIAIKAGAHHLFPDLRVAASAAPSRRFFEHQLFLGTQDRTTSDLVHPAPIVAIAFPRFRPDDPVAVAPLTGAEAVLRLRSEAFNFQRDPERSFRALAALARRVPSVDLTFRSGLDGWHHLLATLRDITS